MIHDKSRIGDPYRGPSGIQAPLPSVVLADALRTLCQWNSQQTSCVCSCLAALVYGQLRVDVTSTQCEIPCMLPTVVHATDMYMYICTAHERVVRYARYSKFKQPPTEHYASNIIMHMYMYVYIYMYVLCSPNKANTLTILLSVWVVSGDQDQA